MEQRARTLPEVLPGFGRIVRAFWPYLRRQRALLVGSLLALWAEIVLRLLEPWPLKFVFDRVIRTSHGSRPSGLLPLESLDSLTVPALAALALVVIPGLRGLPEYGIAGR